MTYKLKAVNRCLRAIGEAPVNSLTSGVADAETAASIIEETTEEVLSAGWHCNTSFNVRLVPDLDKKIIVPATAIKVDTTGAFARINVTVAVDPNDNLTKLFNISDQSFDFTAPVLVDIVHNLPIDHLPFTLQNYIAAKSARIFQTSTMGSVALDSFTAREEQEAWVKLQDAEAEAEDSNIFRDNPYLASIVSRNSYF